MQFHSNRFVPPPVAEASLRAKFALFACASGAFRAFRAFRAPRARRCKLLNREVDGLKLVFEPLLPTLEVFLNPSPLRLSQFLGIATICDKSTHCLPPCVVTWSVIQEYLSYGWDNQAGKPTGRPTRWGL